MFPDAYLLSKYSWGMHFDDIHVYLKNPAQLCISLLAVYSCKAS